MSITTFNNGIVGNRGALDTLTLYVHENVQQVLFSCIVLAPQSVSVREEHAVSLLKTTRTIQGMTIGEKKDFGVGCHMASTKPFFYDTAYKHVKRDYALPINENGKCVLPMLSTQSVRVKSKVPKPLP